MNNYFNLCPNCECTLDPAEKCDCIDQAGRQVAKRQMLAINDIENRIELEDIKND